MPGHKTYYVYIMTNQSRTLYVGFTSDIKKRVWEHRTGLIEGFTERYNIDTLVYIESFTPGLCYCRSVAFFAKWHAEPARRLLKLR